MSCIAIERIEIAFGGLKALDRVSFAAERMAILLVDHNVRRVVRMSHYVYVLSLGEIAAQGPPSAFTGDLHEQVKGWLGINF